MLYVDSSVLLARYIDEPDADRADRLLGTDDDLVTARLTIVEVRRNLARLLDGTALTEARASFAGDLASFNLVELDAGTCERAATVAEHLGVRSLDAVHLGAAQRVGGPGTGFATFDLRQGQAARQLGFAVVGC